MGLAISKKFGCAVKRNYIKRVLREIFRNTDYKQSGKDILVTVRPKLNNDIPFHYIKSIKRIKYLIYVIYLERLVVYF